jgi:hypothetical protein
MIPQIAEMTCNCGVFTHFDARALCYFDRLKGSLAACTGRALSRTLSQVESHGVGKEIESFLCFPCLRLELGGPLLAYVPCLWAHP